MNYLGQRVNEIDASMPSSLRGQKNDLAHIAEGKIIQMTFFFQVFYTHCPVKIEKGRSACCQIYLHYICMGRYKHTFSSRPYEVF